MADENAVTENVRMEGLKRLAESVREQCARFGFRYVHELADYAAQLEALAKAAQIIAEWNRPVTGGFLVSAEDMDRLTRAFTVARESSTGPSGAAGTSADDDVERRTALLVLRFIDDDAQYAPRPAKAVLDALAARVRAAFGVKVEDGTEGT